MLLPTAVSLELVHYFLPPLFLVLYLLVRLLSWLAVRRGGEPVPERVMLAIPAVSVLLFMQTLASPSSYPEKHRTREERAEAETNGSLRRDVDRVMAESRVTHKMLGALINTGWLVALIGLCVPPGKPQPAKSAS